MALRAFCAGTVFGELYNPDPTVLGLHGWGRSHDDFDVVAAERPMLAIDFPGFGASPLPPGGWGSAEYAQHLVPLWEEFETPPLVVAHSFGGRVAMHLAHLVPMRGLVLIGVPLIRPSSNAKPSVTYRTLRWMHRRALLSDDHMESVRQRYGSADYRATSGVMREVFVRVVNESYDAQMTTITVPVHMIWGSQDTAAPVAQALQAFDRFEAIGVDVELTVLDGVGHDVMRERPDVVRSAIDGFGR